VSFKSFFTQDRVLAIIAFKMF